MVGKKIRAFREFRGYSQIPVSYTHLLFPQPYLFIIIGNLSIISFSNIVSLHGLIKQLFVNFL